jgi:hypothetical protein
MFSGEQLREILQEIRQFSRRSPEEQLTAGSGWGALECKMRGEPNGEPAPGFLFPRSSLTGEQRFWNRILEDDPVPSADTPDGPGSFMADPEWKRLLTGAKKKSPENWAIPYHIGVIEYESGDTAAAVESWKRSIRIAPNPWAYRNLAVAYDAQGDSEAALDCYRRAYSCPGSRNDPAIAEEFVSLLVKTDRLEEARTIIDAYTGGAGIENLEGPLLDAAALIAYRDRNEQMLAAVFSKEPARIREGNTTLINLWIEYEADKLAETEGQSKAQAVREIKKSIAEGSIVPPAEIDFRMFTEK